MDEAIISKKRSRAYILLMLSSIIMYVALTSAKNLYSAEYTTLEKIFGNRSDLANTMMYYFYAYAAMQVVLIFFVKKINIKWFLTVTLSISAMLSIYVAFTDTLIEHYVIFAINGILQAGLWGCLLKTLSVYLPARLLPVANMVMSAGPAVAGAMAYGVAAAFGSDWQTPFITLGVILLGAIFFYWFSVTYMSKFPKETETHHVVHEDGSEEDVCDEDENDFIHLNNRKRVIGFYAISLAMGFLLTSLYFMVNNNLAYYLCDIGKFSDTQAKLLTIFAPICAVVGPFMTVRSCEKHRNFIVVCAFYFGVALISAGLLLFLFDKNVILSLSLVVIFIVFVNGGRSVSLSIASLRMRRKIDTGVYSTAVNAVSSLASGLSPKIITAVLDSNKSDVNKAWDTSFLIIFIWALTVVTLLTLTALLVRFINRKKKTENG